MNALSVQKGWKLILINKNMSNVKSCLFGSRSGSDYHYKYEANFLGKLCGISNEELNELSDSRRGLFTRLTDLLLIDPQGRFANALLSNQYTRSNISILRRKIFSVLLLPVPLLCFHDALLYGVNETLLLGAAKMQSIIIGIIIWLIFLIQCCC